MDQGVTFTPLVAPLYPSDVQVAFGLSSRRVVPTVVTYNMLLAFCSWQLGLLVLKDMALQLDTISYNSVARLNPR